MKKSDVDALIAKIGSEGYKDGSSYENSGIPYQPIPFSEFKDVPCHMEKVAGFHDDLDALLQMHNLRPKTILDIGCNIGS